MKTDKWITMFDCPPVGEKFYHERHEGHEINSQLFFVCFAVFVENLFLVELTKIKNDAQPCAVNACVF
jgi:hypothetical protein